jgi:hypothetical protein
MFPISGNIVIGETSLNNRIIASITRYLNLQRKTRANFFLFLLMDMVGGEKVVPFGIFGFGEGASGGVLHVG